MPQEPTTSDGKVPTSATSGLVEALVAQVREEQAKGLGSESDFVFTSLTGRPLGRDRLSKRGVLGAAKRARLGHVTAQTLRRSVATAHAQVPVVVAAAMTGHSSAVYSAHYARPFRDAEEREGAELARCDRVR
jgi:integrase